MRSIRAELLALDTNVFIFGVRRDERYPSCAMLLFERLIDLRVLVPLQVHVELQRNLAANELDRVFAAFVAATESRWDYEPADTNRVEYWERQGAKKGDAVIVAQLEVAKVRYLISENRHFLSEVPGLPFDVLTSQEVLYRLDSG